MTDLREISFKAIVPDSIAGDDTIAAAAQALDGELNRVSRETDLTLVYHRLDELKGDVLNLLAWQFSVDFFDINLPDEKKRDAIRHSIAWHKRKGTPWAVRTALANAGYGAQIFTYKDFRVAMDGAGSLRLDGAWSIDGSESLGRLSVLAGSAHMEIWAQFCVKLDILSFERTGYEAEVRSIVDVAKNVRSHPVYYYFMNLEVENPVSVDSGGQGGKRMECLPMQCDVLLDGSWRIGIDTEGVCLDGAWDLGDGVSLGDMLPAESERRISNCRMGGFGGGGCLVSVRAGFEAEAIEPWFRLESGNRRLDGEWQLGGDLLLDGSWALDGGRFLDVTALGDYALNQLDGLNKVGLIPPQSEVWPNISGGVYGSSSIN